MQNNLITLLFVLLLCLLCAGCVDENNEDEIDLTAYKIMEEDMLNDFQKINEEHITEPYTVSNGSLLAGIKVKEKLEVYYILNTSVFFIQQLACLESTDETNAFMDTFIENTTIPGLMEDWIFSLVSCESFGDEVVLLENVTEIDGHNVTVYLFVFHKGEVVNIFVTSGIEKEELLQRAHIVEDRMNQA